MSGLVLDRGALIAFERCDRKVVGHIARAIDNGESISVPAGVVGQTWRDGRTQVRLARLLGSEECKIVALDDLAARKAGELCRVTSTSDVIDASVVMCARQMAGLVLTSDSDDLLRLDPRLGVIAI